MVPAARHFFSVADRSSWFDVLLWQHRCGLMEPTATELDKGRFSVESGVQLGHGECPSLPRPSCEQRVTLGDDTACPKCCCDVVVAFCCDVVLSTCMP